MKNSVGNLAIIISGDAKNFTEVMAGVEQHMAAQQARMDAQQRKSQTGMLSGIGTYAKAAAAAYVTGRLGREMLEVGQNAIQLSRDLEVSEKQLKTLTGSAAAAREVLADLRMFSAASPFGVDEVSSVARKLMGGGLGREQSLTATKQIAAVGAGTGGDLSSLGRAYSQVMANGRFMTEELNQFSDADFPITEFAKTYGKSMGRLRDDMSKGLVPVTVMADTFKRLTDEGGKFANALKDMTDTATGRMKKEKAAHDAYLAERGAKLESMGASGRQIGQWWERGAVDAQVFGAAVWEGIGNYFGDIDWNSNSRKKGGLGTYIDRALNPELYDMEKQKAELATEKRNREEADFDRQMQRGYGSIKIADFLEGLPKRIEDLAESAKNFLAASQPGNAFRRGAVPEWAADHPGLRKAMEWGDLDAAAKIVQDMQQSQAGRMQFRFAPAAARGSQEAEQVLSRAMESAFGGGKISAEDAIKESNRILRESKAELEKIKDELRNLQPNVARF